MSSEMIGNLGNTQAMMYHAIRKQPFQHIIVNPLDKEEYFG
jgi:hypothetical protein